jgi:hypothetical protein
MISPKQSTSANEVDVVASPLDKRDGVCHPLYVSGDQFITELKLKVAFHQRQLQIWQTALEAALHPETKAAATKAKPAEPKKPSHKAEKPPSAFIVDLITMAGPSGIRSNDIKAEAKANSLSYGKSAGFPYKQLNRLKRIGKVRSDESGRYTLKPT